MDRAEKAWANLRAQLAFAGYAAERLSTADGGSEYAVSRWRFIQTFSSFERLRDWATRVLGINHVAQECGNDVGVPDGHRP